MSHDRHFLDQVVDKIWELKDGGISEFWGDYSDYLRQKEEERKLRRLDTKRRCASAIASKPPSKNSGKKARQVDAKRKGAKKSNEYAGRLGHQKTTGTKQKKMHQAAKNMEKRSKRSKGSRPQIAFAPCASARARPWNCIVNFPSRQMISA